MATSVSTGWRTVTPGPCPICGCTDDYGCDGNGNVRCSCDPEFDESHDTTEARAATHWVVGGGSVGCLYDFGPQPCETLEEALDELDTVYQLSTAERNQLRWHKHLAFDEPERREEAGADYCEITMHDGPCPEGD